MKFLALVSIFIFFPLLTNAQSGPLKRSSIQEMLVAHALGQIDGNRYLNCKECFDNSYAKGFRLMEADFHITSDHKVVAMHDGLEARFGLPNDFTHRDFMKTKLDGKYSPLDGPALAKIIKAKRDWTLVTDVKESNAKVLRLLCADLAKENVDCRLRLIPQIYNFSELSILEEMRFDRAILTLYRFDRPTGREEIVPICCGAR